MEFTKIISSPVFAASAPDIGLEAQSASPVKIVVTTPSASWDITLSPVSDADGKNLLNIRLRDILSAVASAPTPSETEPNSAIPLLMVNLSASNTEGEQASMDIPVAFGTLNGKDPKDFTGQWLTSREQICLTYSWARERLSLIFGPQLLRWSGSVSLTVNCRAYYASGKARNFQLVSAGSSDAVYYSVDCSYSAISALDDSGEQLVAWDLSYTLSGINADGESDSVDSFPQRFILANQDGHIREYIFANCFGMEDRVFGEGVARREVSGSSSTFVNGGKTLEVSNDAEIVYEAFSGQLADRRAVFHWYDFLSSSSRLIFSAADGSMTHIVVEGHDSETDDFSVGGVSFSYRLSEKNGVYPDGLCGTIGDYDPNQQCGALWVGDDPQAVTPAEEDLFFLKHRLSEFQTLTVSDALLLLVQSPATDAWGSVSLGSIKSWIKKFLDGESREIRLNSLADYETADGKVIDPAKLQNGSIPVWDAAAGAYHPVPASELGDYGINPKLYPLVFQKGKDVVLTYAPNVGKAVLDISDFASAETLSTHISDKDIHVTAEQKSAWDLVASLFGVDEDGNIYVKDNRGFYGNSFISARGSDPGAGSGGSGGLDVQAMWYALGQPTSERINASHIPVIGMDKVTGLQSALSTKLESITKPMVEEVLTGTITSHNHDGRYAPLSGGLIPSQYLPSYVDDVLEYASKTAFPATGEAGKIYVATDTNLTYRWGGSAYVEISPSLALGYTSSTAYPGDEGAALAALVEGMKEITDLFGIDEDGNVYVKGGKGFYGTSFVSARGSDPLAGSSGAGGLDIDAMWEALAAAGTQKINASHIPLLQQLSGQITNAQLANPSLSVAGVSVPLGGAVSAEQIASALGLGSNAYTSTAYLPLAGGTMSGTLTFPTATEAYNSLGVRFSGVSSRIGVDAAGGLGLYAQDAIYLRPSWTSGGTLYGLIIRASDLTYNGNPLLHAGNYTNYTVTKTGGGASGTWPISVSGSSNTLISTTDTAISNYVRYRQVSGSPSLVGSTAGGGAWGLPSTGPDAEYANGQILRLGWSPEYYTDIFTGPNDFGAAAGLQFRQIVNGKMSSRGWRTLLDSANYTSYAVSLTGAQTISGAKTFTSLVTATGGVYSPKGLFGLTEAQANSYAGSVYYKLAVGQQSPSMGASLLLYRDSTSYQSYIVWSTGSADHVGVGLKNGTIDFDITNHKGAIKLIGQGILTYNNYTLWHAGNDGSGSGLDADLLDGYHSTSFNLATNLGACQDYGCYVIGLMQITDYTTAGNHANGELIFIRQNGNNPAQKIIYSLSTRYGTTNVRFGYLLFSTNSYVKPCTFTYNGKKWAGFCVDAASSYSNGITCIRDGARLGERSTPFLLKYKVLNTGEVLNSEVNNSLVVNGSDITDCGVSARSFIGALSGNASSATKLATARLLWGRSFDGSGDIRGNIIVGDAIIHGSVTSNNTRFISSDNASNIYFSVGGLVDLVAEPSCLRRGASNTSETLGTSTYRWANVYAVNGDFSGNLTVSGWLNGGLNISIFGSNSDNSDTTRFLTYGHNVEFGGPGYAHVNYYLRPRYGAYGETYASVYIQNASAAASPVFATTHAFYHSGNVFHWGNVGIGTLPTSYKLHVVGTGYFSSNLEVAGTIHSSVGIWSNGYVSAKGQDTTSDARYKRDVAALPARGALSVLMRLRPATWAWKDDGRRGAGFVAQEVLGVLPEAVREVGDGEDRHLALNYQMLHAYEVCLLQTHETELERLRGRVKQLENEIKRIRYGS